MLLQNCGVALLTLLDDLLHLIIGVVEQGSVSHWRECILSQHHVKKVQGHGTLASLQCDLQLLSNHQLDLILQSLSLSPQQGLGNVPIKHHPTIGDIISNKYLQVRFKIPKKGHLPSPAQFSALFEGIPFRSVLVDAADRSHWTHQASQTDFSSGLGSSVTEQTPSSFSYIATKWVCLKMPGAHPKKIMAF